MVLTLITDKKKKKITNRERGTSQDFPFSIKRLKHYGKSI